MSVADLKQKVMYEMVKDRMDEIGLTYTEEQANQMADFVNGVVMLTQAVQKDIIINKIKELNLWKKNIIAQIVKVN